MQKSKNNKKKINKLLSVFDPSQVHDEKNPNYKKMHEEYKNLVDFMLASYMEEMQITPEQFEVACLEGRNNYDNHAENPLSLHNGLFQQIWAANDIRIFIKMLTQRNLELQLQALDLIERRQASNSKDDDDEPVVNESLYNDGKVPTEIELPEDEVVLSTMQIIEEKLKEEREAAAKSEEEEPVVNEDKFKRLNLFFENDRIDNEQMRQRQEYLRAQRDRILQIKKQARARQLNETAKKADRPKSAQAAQKLLENPEAVIGEATTDASLQLRRMLAKRLKVEVVEGAVGGAAEETG